MSFNLGQFRRDQLVINSYRSALDGYSVQDKIVTSSISSSIKFVDQSIVLADGTFLDSAKSYYLKVSIHRNQNREQNLTITLQNSSSLNSIQTFDTVYIPKGSSSSNNNVTFEIVLAPNGAYNEIVFTMDRNNVADISRNNGDGTYGAKVNIQVEELSEIYNILNAMNPKPERLIKIGVQGRSGLLMDINGEPIRIGPSGIYEINNGYKINYMGFILQDSPSTADGKDYFILDYQY